MKVIFYVAALILGLVVFVPGVPGGVGSTVFGVCVMLMAWVVLTWLVGLFRRSVQKVEAVEKSGGEGFGGRYMLAKLFVAGVVYWLVGRFLEWRMPGVEPDLWVRVAVFVPVYALVFDVFGEGKRG